MQKLTGRMYFTKLFALILLCGYVPAMYIDIDEPGEPKEKEPANCYVCNSTSCDDAEEFDKEGKPVSKKKCTREEPHCATYHSFISVLGCAKATATVCTLHNPDQSTFLITCVCDTDLCNTPFSREVRTYLSHSRDWSNHVSVAVGPMAVQAHPTSFTERHIYKMKTAVPVPKDLQMKATSILATITTVYLNMTKTKLFDDYSGPRTEFLKRHTTIPSDDEDEDADGEGSGDYQEPKYFEPVSSTTDVPTTTDKPEIENMAHTIYVHVAVAITPILLFIVA